MSAEMKKDSLPEKMTPSSTLSRVVGKLCYICNQPQISRELTSMSLKIHGVNGTEKEKLNIMRIISQLLHVKWDLIVEWFRDSFNLPFCISCIPMILNLITLRDKLVELETELMKRIWDLGHKIEMTQIVTRDEEFMGEQSRRIFRNQALEEHRAKNLLREKTDELRATMLRKDSEHIIEIEPAFVQLHLGLSASSKETPTTLGGVDSQTLLSELREETEVHEPEMGSEPIPIKDEDNGKINWMENLNRPLTRLRLARSVANQTIKEEPPEDDVNESIVEVNYNDEEEDTDFHVEDAGATDDDISDFELDIRTKSHCEKRGRKSNKQQVNYSLRSTEEFAEIVEDENGRLFFEGIEILFKNGDSQRGAFFLKCGMCNKEIDKRAATTRQKCIYKMMKVHIKAAHLLAYQCDLCGRKLSCYRHLLQHIENRQGNRCRKQQKARIFGSAKFQPEVVVSSDGRVEFEGVELVRMEGENGDFNIQCGQCGKTLNSTQARKLKQCPYRQMVNHIKGFHLKVFHCSKCDKSFKNSKSFLGHMKYKHSSQPRNSQCEVCGKTILGTRYMKRHLWTHKNDEERQAALASGEKEPESYAALMERLRARKESFQCHECGKTFEFVSNLRKHEQRLHMGCSKNHQCTQCGKFYSTNESLQSHIKYVHEIERVHKKYRCQFCSKCFVSKTPWMKHERTHTKEIPYSCPVCNKGFALKQSMVKHVRNKKCLLRGSSPNSKESHKSSYSTVEVKASELNRSLAIMPPTINHQHPLYITAGIPISTHKSNTMASIAAISESPFNPRSRPSFDPRCAQPQPNFEGYV